MRPMELERRVAAPASRVWSLMTDLERAPQLVSGISRVERLDGGSHFDVGTRWRETRTVFGRDATEELEVTALEPGRRYVVEADSRGAHYRSVLGVEPLDPGHSRLHMSFEAEPSGVLGRLVSTAMGVLFGGATRRMLQQDLDDIARAAETGQPGDVRPG